MTALTLAEAVSLGYALVARVARDSGVRALAIKGPIATAQGLRPADSVSVDVDVWVDPSALDCFRTSLRKAGWRVCVEPTSAQVMTLHSVAHSHVAWPCEVDVHDRYPGFLAPPQVVFDLFWSRRTTATIGGVEVECVDRVGSSIIHALHRIRDYGPDSGSVSDFADRSRSLLTQAELRELKELARATGATGPLAPYLARLGVVMEPEDGFEEDMRAWRIVTTSPGAKSVPAVYELARSPLRAWPRLAWRSVVLTEDEIRARQPGAAPGARGLFVARIKRIEWGARGLPRAVLVVARELRRNRRTH